jgi:hypothetical protein
MHSHESLQIQPAITMPGDNQQIALLKEKLNEVIRKLDEAYRLLHMDVRIMDFREAPPHAGIDHASWKWCENLSTGDLELWHRNGNTWSFIEWSVIGNLTRRPSVG